MSLSVYSTLVYSDYVELVKGVSRLKRQLVFLIEFFQSMVLGSVSLCCFRFS